MRTLGKFVRDLRVTMIGVWAAMAVIVALTTIVAAVLVATIGRCWPTGILTTSFLVGATILYHHFLLGRWLQEAGISEAEVSSGVVLVRGWMRAYWAWFLRRLDQADVETLIENVSENIPGSVKVFAISWLGIYAAVAGIVALSMLHGFFLAAIFGKGTLPAATTCLDLVSLIGFYFGFILPKWLDEDWQVCSNCDQPIPGPGWHYFCDQCGIQLRNLPVAA